jgi:ABC-type Fe3+-siderophore transport system permease subunit
MTASSTRYGAATAPTPPAARAASVRERSGVVTVVFAVLVVLVIGLAVLSVCLGAVTLSFRELLDGLTGGSDSFVVQQYRLPRVEVALLAGAALAVSGVLLQAAVRNQLASPDVIGVTKGAGLGAMLASLFVPAAARLWAVPLGVVIGAVTVTLVLLWVGRRVGGKGTTLALVGVAIAALAGAVMQYLMVLFPQDADQALVWLAGSVYGSTPAEALWLGVWSLVCIPAVLLAMHRIDLAGFGDDSLTSLGRRPATNRTLLVAVAVALAVGAVATVGGIGFLGLLAPHLARLLVGPRARRLVPASALIGAVLLSLADLVGRVVALPNEVPAGIVAAVAGGPYLLFLLIREARSNV